MPEYQLLRCEIALGGERDTTVVRDRYRPIMFPELIMLQHIHGDDAVFDIHVVGTCEMGVDEVRTRLLTIYGEEVVKEVFPGARPVYPRADSTIPLCTKPILVPRPTRPESPDPVLRPLDSFTTGDNVPREYYDPPKEAPLPPAREEFSDDEMRAEATANELGLGPASKPTGAALAGGRPGYAGSHAGARGSTLPDVAATSTDRKAGRHQSDAR